VATFRCPVCISMVVDLRARRCGTCGKRLRASELRTLGDDTRLTATQLPIDRWMLDRVHAGAGAMPPVPWHGRFAPVTPELAGATVADTAPPPATSSPFPPTAPEAPSSPIAAPSDLGSPVAPSPAPVAPADDRELRWVRPKPVRHEASDDAQGAAQNRDRQAAPETAPKSPSADALGLEQYTRMDSPATEPPTWRTKRPFDAFMAAPAPSADVAPPADVAAPLLREQVDPAVRALVEDLYEQARAELAGEAARTAAPRNGDRPDTDGSGGVSG
jgi:hypothetical protein